MSEEEMLNKLIPYEQALKITDEDIELLKEMKKNCLKLNVYEDDKRLLKANAISKFLIFYEENKKIQQENQELKNNIMDLQKELNEENLQCSKYAIENQELKKQLKKCYCNRTDCSGRIKGSKTYDSLEQKIKNQQKEFIEYLENEKDRLIRECSHHYEDSFGRYHVVNENIYDEVDKNLQKYKEILGGKDE